MFLYALRCTFLSVNWFLRIPAGKRVNLTLLIILFSPIQLNSGIVASSVIDCFIPKTFQFILWTRLLLIWYDILYYIMLCYVRYLWYMIKAMKASYTHRHFSQILLWSQDRAVVYLQEAKFVSKGRRVAAVNACQWDKTAINKYTFW
jgi:hypothetical protein